MKRLIISIVLLGLVAGLCTVCLHTQQTNTQELLQMLNSMEEKYKSKDLDACHALSDDFPKAFNEKTRAFSLFLYHNHLTAIKEVAVTLPVILREKDNSHYLVELTRCRTLLEKLEELEQPTWDNIL